MKGKWRVAAGICLLAAGLAGCAKDKQTEEREEIPLPKPVKEQTIAMDEIEQPVEQYSAPFTGTLYEDEKVMRPVMTTINNHPKARPQSGISEADIVYELAAEGNVTRLLAVFQSELPEEIGPIRSARDYFVHMAKGMDAFYVAHGYSPDAQKLLQQGYVDHINGMAYDGILFHRSKERRAPHNSYTSSRDIEAGAEKTNSSLEITKMPPLSFHDSIENAKMGKNASSVTVRYGNDPDFASTYDYDTEAETYSRTVNGIQTADKTNEQPVVLSNIVMMETNHRTIDSAGRQAVDVESGGRALLFQAGTVKELEWANVDGVLTPVENGTPVKLVPGKTWVHIVAANPGMTNTVTYTE